MTGTEHATSGSNEEEDCVIINWQYHKLAKAETSVHRDTN